MVTQLNTMVFVVHPLGELERKNWVHAKWMQDDDDRVTEERERNRL